MRLLTHNPDKVAALTGLGLVVAATLPSGAPVPLEAQAYLQAKVDRLGHHPHAPAVATDATPSQTPLHPPIVRSTA